MTCRRTLKYTQTPDPNIKPLNPIHSLVSGINHTVRFECRGSFQGDNKKLPKYKKGNDHNRNIHDLKRDL